MQARRSGIAPVVITVTVIALVVVAAVAGYVLLAKGPTSSSSVSTSSSSTTVSAQTSVISSSTGAGTSIQSSSTTSVTGTASSSSTSSITSGTTASTGQTSSSSTSLTTTTTSSSSSNACATNTTTTTSSESPPLTDFATLLGNFSQISLTLGSHAGAGISHSESSYSVAYASHLDGQTTYKVDIDDNVSGASSLTQAWITSSGDVIAFNSGGGNETGTQASSALSSSAAPFLSLIVQGQLLNLYTSSPQVQPVNQTGVMLGPTSLYVTNFAATSLPAFASTCTDAYTFASFSLQAVAISGTDIILVTQENIQGTDVSGSVTTPVYAVLQITSLTQA